MWKRLNLYVAISAIIFVFYYFWTEPSVNQDTLNTARQSSDVLLWFLVGTLFGAYGLVLPLIALVEKHFSPPKGDPRYFIIFGVITGTELGFGVIMGFLHVSPWPILWYLLGVLCSLCFFFRIAWHIHPAPKTTD